MKYQITRQYARDEEKPLAEFCDFNDAKTFLGKRLFFDEMQNIKIIYRLFKDKKLFREFNKEKINTPINRAQYAQEDRDLPDSFLFRFKVIMHEKQAAPFATFDNLNDARIFVEEKLVADSESAVNFNYNMFDNSMLLETWNQGMLNDIKKQNEGSQGKARAISFRPTPFNTSPRPPGSPPPWIIDIDEDDDKKE